MVWTLWTLSDLFYLQALAPVTTITSQLSAQNSDQDKILSFLANSPQTRDPGL